MSGTNKCVKEILSLVGDVLITNKRALAIRAEYQTAKNIRRRAQVVMSAQLFIICVVVFRFDSLNLEEGFFVDQRFMGIPNDNPFLLWKFPAFMSLGKPGALSPLHQMA